MTPEDRLNNLEAYIKSIRNMSTDIANMTKNQDVVIAARNIEGETHDALEELVALENWYEKITGDDC